MPQGADDRNVNHGLSTLPDPEVVGDDLDSAPVRSRLVEDKIAQGSIRGNPSSCLAASTSCCTIEGASTTG